MAVDPSPKRIQEALEAVADFKAAYTAYLEAGPEGDQRLRQEVHRTMPAAQRALNLVDANIAMADPPALGAHRQVYSGLATLAFLHEQPGWRLSGMTGAPEVYEMVLDSLDMATARLADRKRQATTRRRNPLYWIDRAFRALLLIPAYLVGLVIGESAFKIDRSAWGLPLRLLAIVADVLGLYGAGKAFGWW